MSLKHLLNENEIEIQPLHDPQISWNDLGGFAEIDPLYSSQPWPQCEGETFTSEALLNESGIPFSTEVGSDLNLESFQYAQNQIEQWVTGTEPQETQGAGLVVNEEFICYGMIYRAQVKLRGDMGQLDSRLSVEVPSAATGHVQMGLKRSDDGELLIAFLDGCILGAVNAQLEKALTSIAEQRLELDFEVFAPTRNIREIIGRANKDRDAVVRVQVNIYGPRSTAASVGRELSRHRVYLQRPDYVRNGAAYDNPHVLKIADFDSTPSELAETILEQPVPEAATVTFKKTITDVYSTLTRDQHLEGLEGDDRLRTPLLLHQKTALDFMTQREDGPVPDRYSLWRPTTLDGNPCYRHAVTGTISRLDHTETGGGILADEMGMGKSLSMLALIVRSLNTAHAWANGIGVSLTDKVNEWNHKGRSKATLIVASSDLMINEWFQELEKHFGSAHMLKTIKYHGPNRRCSVDRLCGADLVVTTYHTLASDFSSAKNILNELEWYRLVLDEAHIIRRQSTGLYRTVAELRARSRWCLTGTPIQNRLEDIGSLFAFLKISPFHNLSTFKKYIAVPFDEGEKRRSLAIERFTRLLDSVCLRRTKDLLHLPDQQSQIRQIHLSPEERKQYEQTHNIMFRAARNQVGVFDQKSTLGMFQIQLQLRILCNHGTWQQLFSWSRHKLHLLDEREAVEASMGRDGEATCSACRQTMPLFGTGSMFHRYTENCRHILCSECLEESDASNKEHLPASCPLCSSLWRTSKQGHPPKQHSQEDTYFKAEGKSSKMEALMADVSEDVWTTKSIIFTCWTRTLDLIQHYLRERHLTDRNVQRIDGDCPTAKRERILEEFAKCPELRILIMTTGTGAVGLNLAVANRVFIVEPQWNPSVENQAIARALRLGQKQPVLVTRYVVEGSVEQTMRKLQDTKLEKSNLVNSG